MMLPMFGLYHIELQYLCLDSSLVIVKTYRVFESHLDGSLLRL